MSYRKERNPSKPEPTEQQTLTPEVKYNNPGVSRDLSTSKLTSGLAYEQEAELYYMLDRTRGKLRLSHEAKALLESGSDSRGDTPLHTATGWKQAAALIFTGGFEKLYQ